MKINLFRLIAIVAFNLSYLFEFSFGESQCTEFNPCKNLADCLMRDGDLSRVRCVCKRGFSGNLCEKWPRVCGSDFCFNGGTCVLLKRIPVCLCQSDFKGLFCENLTFPSKMLEKINTAEASNQNDSISAYQDVNPIEYTSSKSVTTRSNPPPIEFFTPPNPSSPPIEQINAPYYPNSFLIEQTEPKQIDTNPFIIPMQTSDFLASTPQTQETNLPLSTTSPSFVTFEYPKEFFINMENQQQTSNNNYLTEATTQAQSICSFDPCLNYGNCIPITNSNSLFKFRCVCPENYNGILCENFSNSQNIKTKEAANDSNYFSYLYFTEPLKSDTSSTSMFTTTETHETTDTTTTTTTTSTTTATTSTTPIPITTTNTIESSSIANKAFSFVRNQKKYSICTQLRPCANNGQCIDVENYNEGMQRFRCICKADFTGIFCHIKLNRRKVNACTYNSCLNSGECIPSNNSFSCVCPPSYTGKFCELNSY